jgi:thiamine-monophosphate kinase
LQVIGRVVAGQGVQLLDEQGRVITPPQRGYQHFGSSGD